MTAIHLTKTNFSEKVLKIGVVALVDLWAPWCGPCRMVGPIIDELALEYKDKIVVGKINVDEEPELAGKYGAMSIPTVLLLKDGKEMERQVGFVGKEGYQAMLDKFLK